MPAAMSSAPRSPSTRRISAVAGVFVAASPSAPSARRQATLTSSVEQYHAAHAEQQPARQVAPRVAHLARDEARRLPAAVREHHGRQRRAEAASSPSEAGRSSSGPPVRACGSATANRPHATSAATARIFRTIKRLCTLLPARTPRQLTTVSSSERERGRDPVGQGRAGQLREVAREGDGDRRHPSRLHDEQQRPAVEERDRRVEGFAQVRVLPADLRAARGQLGVDERARERDGAARRATRRG